MNFTQFDVLKCFYMDIEKYKKLSIFMQIIIMKIERKD